MSVSLDLGLASATRGLPIPAVDGVVYVSGRGADRVPPAPAPLSGVVTVAVDIADGGFVVAADAGESAVCDGQGLAAILAAHILPGTDLRFWLCWPEDSQAWARLRRNLWELAESTGSVVWTPPGGGQVDVVPGCRDLGCTVKGEPAVWEAYHPRSQRRMRFNSDADGRLVPAGRLSFDSLPLDDGALMLHMPVLEDGRLAAFCTDGSTYPLGPRQLFNCLHECGWAGEPIVLAEEVGSLQAMRLSGYLDDVGFALGRQLPIRTRPVRAYAPEVRARHVTSSRPRTLPSATSLVDQVIDLLTELPSFQLQCRTLFRDDPAGSTDLLTEWYDLHRQLVEARHAPATRAVWASQSTMDVGMTETDRRDAVERADALGRARNRFVQHLNAVRLAAGMQLALPGTGSVIDAHWDGHLRTVTSVALARLDPSDPDQARQMRGLAQAISRLATAPEPELDDPDPLGHPAVQLGCTSSGSPPALTSAPSRGSRSEQ